MVRRLGSIVGVVLAVGVAHSGFAADDVVLADFEGTSFPGWTVVGKAFGSSPIRPADTDSAKRIHGHAGNGLAASRGDASVEASGHLFSPEFIVTRRFLNFRIGGGRHPFRAAISLWHRGRVVRTSTGSNTDALEPVNWDLADLAGATVHVGLHDLCLGDEPNGYLLVDDIRLSDRAAGRTEGGVSAAQRGVREDALAAIRRNAPRAALDPQRPVFHYTPPAQRMNDPNGPAWNEGYHHLFYQHMVFVEHGSATNVHWGHARSRDLVNWETLPLAIAPDYVNGEHSVFSGNLARTAQGSAVLMTTMVPYRENTARRIWLARPATTDWVRWERESQPPAGLLPQNGPSQHMKDPFPFQVGNRNFVILTADGMPIYEAVAEDLSRWECRSYLTRTIEECPNLFEFDGRWVYVSSPHGPPRYAIGRFDAETGSFHASSEGRINHTTHFYAPSTYRDAMGRTIMHGVTRGQKSGMGWTGALALPRLVSLGDDGLLRFRPLPEFQKLRRDAFAIRGPMALANGARIVDGLRGDTLEIIIRFKAQGAAAFGLRTRRSDDGSRAFDIQWSDGRVVLGQDTPNLPCMYALQPNGEIELHVFLDKGIVDACIDDGRLFETRIFSAQPGDLGIEVFSEGGETTVISLQAWRLAPADIVHERLFADR